MKRIHKISCNDKGKYGIIKGYQNKKKYWAATRKSILPERRFAPVRRV